MIEKFRSLVRREKAFTLVELLIVIAIIAILTVAFLPGALRAPAKARDVARQKAVRDIHAAVEAYIAENNGRVPGNGSNCFNSSVVVASSFNSLPLDPRPQTNDQNTSCGNFEDRDKYLYMTRPVEGNPTFYVAGARMEIQTSGNTNLTRGGGGALDITTATLQQLQTGTLASGNGNATTVTPNATNPFFIVIGPR